MGGNQTFLFSGFYFPDALLSFFAILLEGAPFLLMGALFSALVDFFLPVQRLRQWLPNKRIPGILSAIGASFFLPLCECSSIAIAGRLIRKGIPVSVAITYLLASPLFNPLTIISTYFAFRTQNPWLIISLRLGIGAIVVFGLGLWISSKKPEQILRPELLLGNLDNVTSNNFNFIVRPNTPFPSFQRFCALIIRDFTSITPFFVVGAAFAAFSSVGFNRNDLSSLAQNQFVGPLIGIILAQLLCLCSTADAFVIATFGSLSNAAKIAFLVAGPLFDLKLYWLYQSLFQKRFVHALWWRALLAIFVLTSIYGFFSHS